MHRTLTNSEARRIAARQTRAERLRAIDVRERSPEKALMRDYIDARLNLGEFLLPVGRGDPGDHGARLVLAERSRSSPRWLMYLFILAVFVDGFLMWRGFKRVLAERLPNAPTKGLLMYGMTRSTQIRRFRMPPPRIKRGEAY